jgi:hypothetical protein
MDDQPTAASAPGTALPRAIEAPGLFAVLEALALAALDLDATKRSTPGVDDRPPAGETP